MPYTLKQAAEATGKSKSTIFRAIKNHTISGTRDHNGEWMIDPAKVSPAHLFAYYQKAWGEGIKTVYYVRSLSGEVKDDDCVSCSG